MWQLCPVADNIIKLCVPQQNPYLSTYDISLCGSDPYSMHAKVAFVSSLKQCSLRQGRYIQNW